jgi:hypothetical protein
MPGNWHVRFGGGPYGKGPANCGHLAVRPTQPFPQTPTLRHGAAYHRQRRSSTLAGTVAGGDDVSCGLRHDRREQDGRSFVQHASEKPCRRPSLRGM